MFQYLIKNKIRVGCILATLMFLPFIIKCIQKGSYFTGIMLLIFLVFFLFIFIYGEVVEPGKNGHGDGGFSGGGDCGGGDGGCGGD